MEKIYFDSYDKELLMEVLHDNNKVEVIVCSTCNEKIPVELLYDAEYEDEDFRCFICADVVSLEDGIEKIRYSELKENGWEILEEIDD